MAENDPLSRRPAEAPSWAADSYQVRAGGGLYPEGWAVTTTTAAGALQRYRGLKLACEWAEVRSADGVRLSGQRLVELARSEGANRG